VRRALVALGLVALALGTWRSFPVLDPEGPSAPALRSVVVDISAGTTRVRPGHGLWLRRAVREEALAAAAAGEELQVVRYGAEVEDLGLAPAGDWLARLEGRGGEVLVLEAPGTAGLGSELDAALALAEAPLTLTDRAGARLVLLAADDTTGPPPAPRLARLAASGVRVERRTLPPPTRADLALVGLHLPARPAAGEPLAARLDLALVLPPGAEAPPLEAELELHAAAGVRRERARLVPPPGGGSARRWSVTVPLGEAPSGWMELRARVGLREPGGASLPDAAPENDLATARTRSGEARQVLVLAAPDRAAAALAWIGPPGAWPGLELRLAHPAELATGTADLDLVVSFDLGPRDLPARWLESLVASGAGLLFCGGWGSLAGWEPGSDEGVAALLPLAPREEDARPRDVVFFVDGSGSMAGGPFEAVRRALAALVPAVGRGDDLFLQFFTGTPMAPVDLRAGEGGAAEALERLFGSRPPSGATAVLYSLEALAEARRGTRREGLVFLLSDGRDDLAHDVEARGDALLRELSRSRTRLVVVAAGDAPDLELLGHLVPEGDAVHRAGDEEDLAAFFQRQVFGRRLREGLLPLVAGPEPALPESAELAAAWSAGELPVHGRFLRCEARPGADVLWEAEEGGEPVLALWRVGAGRVAAWAAGPLEGWVPGSTGPAGRALLAPLLRRLARPASIEAPELSASGGRLVLAPVPGGWPAELRARFLARPGASGPLGAGLEVELGEAPLLAGAAPGGDPRSRRSAPLPDFLARLTGARPVVAVLEDPVSGRVLESVGLDLPAATELLPGARREDLAGALAGLPEGRGLEASGRGRLPAPDAWAWLTAAAALLAGAAFLGAVGGARGEA
jgi:Mg-chelatase subunit ChlD